MTKCINLAYSNVNLYVLYIKLAQKTKQFRRLVLENLITVINFLYAVEKAFYGLRTWVLGLLNIFPPPPPPCTSKPLPYTYVTTTAITKAILRLKTLAFIPS